MASTLSLSEARYHWGKLEAHSFEKPNHITVLNHLSVAATKTVVKSKHVIEFLIGWLSGHVAANGIAGSRIMISCFHVQRFTQIQCYD